MNTFLPYPDFALSARCLDRARLGKQRIEVLQLLRGQWPNHPASRMWRGYEVALCHYGWAICDEWLERGYKDTVRQQLHVEGSYVAPWWLGDPEFHASHRSNLLRKSLLHYSSYGWEESPFLPYVWPKEIPRIA